MIFVKILCIGNYSSGKKEYVIVPRFREKQLYRPHQALMGKDTK